jgi:hypothetical protein
VAAAACCLSQAAVATAALAQDTVLSAGDVRALTAAVVESMLPIGFYIDNRPAEERPLLVGQREAFEALRVLAPAATATDVRPGRSFRPLERDDAIRCTRAPRRRCEVVDRGVFVTFTAAERIRASGEVRVRAAARWAGAVAVGGDVPGFTGFVMDVVLTRTPDGWTVARRSPRVRAAVADSTS